MVDEVLAELQRISKILLVSNAEVIERELSKIATTDERKRIWVMIDGNRKQEEIAQLLHLARRTVNIFVGILTAANLVQAPRGEPPRRILDYVPPTWLDLVKLPTEESDEKTESHPSRNLSRQLTVV